MPNTSHIAAVSVNERRVDTPHGSIFVQEAPGDGPAATPPGHLRLVSGDVLVSAAHRGRKHARDAFVRVTDLRRLARQVSVPSFYRMAGWARRSA
jgi:hypothetical protein